MARNEKRVRKDEAAADLIRRMRINEGLSRHDLARAIADKGVNKGGFDRGRVSVSEDTLYLIEKFHREPGPRIKFAIAYYFDLRPGQIWKRDALGSQAAAVGALAA